MARRFPPKTRRLPHKGVTLHGTFVFSVVGVVVLLQCYCYTHDTSYVVASNICFGKLSVEAGVVVVSFLFAFGVGVLEYTEYL